MYPMNGYTLYIKYFIDLCFLRFNQNEIENIDDQVNESTNESGHFEMDKILWK